VNPFEFQAANSQCRHVVLRYRLGYGLCPLIRFAAPTDVVSKAVMAKQHVTTFKTDKKKVLILHEAVKGEITADHF
jgi:hypothetical protein